MSYVESMSLETVQTLWSGLCVIGENVAWNMHCHEAPYFETDIVGERAILYTFDNLAIQMKMAKTQPKMVRFPICKRVL